MGARVMISSSDNSHSISMGSITAVNSEALDDHPGYSILWFELTDKESSATGEYFLYFVPNHYVNAIKQTITSVYAQLQMMEAAKPKK
mmetsp:Transcript_14473/g.36893  ORF Transcript_14473/g.36893 Transcript_14473/m.36893 type:complete len:88 (+) Transcript_14473:225-488(+)